MEGVSVPYAIPGLANPVKWCVLVGNVLLMGLTRPPGGLHPTDNPPPDGAQGSAEAPAQSRDARTAHGDPGLVEQLDLAQAASLGRQLAYLIESHYG